jgi:hypothetical protein
LSEFVIDQLAREAEEEEENDDDAGSDETSRKDGQSGESTTREFRLRIGGGTL